MRVQKGESLLANINKHKGLFLMALPAVLLIFLFHYVPIFGLVVAFKDFNFSDGIWNSPWVGLQNFKFMVTAKDITIRILRNTVGYWVLFTAVGTVLNLALAIAVNECKLKVYAKTTHTIMILPTFISWIAVTYIAKALLDGQNGMVNHILASMGRPTVQWYAEAGRWPLILLLINVWKGTGYGAIIYLSALAGMDEELFEAARLDGAGRWQQIWHITLPMLRPLVCITTLLALGGIMTSNTGLFYQVTKNVGALYPTTQTIDAYVMDTLTNGSTDFGLTSAVTFFQSVVGCIMVVGTNMIVKRWDADHALFA